MKKINKNSILVGLVAVSVLSLGGVIATFSRAGAAQPTVDLKTAAPFAILAGTGVTNVPTSTITGDVGVSPATGASITGLTCAEVTGTIYTVDAAGPACRVVDGPLLVTAKNDLTAAFIDAAGRTPVTTVPTELGGTTKTAGVYDSASTTFEITAGAGPLVLDGQGDASAVFIFEMDAAGTGLTVGPGSTVSLVNGAQACNVFWRVDTAAIDTTAVFKGNILALNSITVANGANIEGRLLARNGNVTLISDTITRPVCVTTSGSGSGSGSGSASSTPTLPNAGGNSKRWSSTVWILAILAVVLAAFALRGVAQKKKSLAIRKKPASVVRKKSAARPKRKRK